MRPIVIAVGLIRILAHDYLIVKIKMLFRYSVAIVDDQLSVDLKWSINTVKLEPVHIKT